MQTINKDIYNKNKKKIITLEAQCDAYDKKMEEIKPVMHKWKNKVDIQYDVWLISKEHQQLMAQNLIDAKDKARHEVCKKKLKDIKTLEDKYRLSRIKAEEEHDKLQSLESKASVPLKKYLSLLSKGIKMNNELLQLCQNKTK